MLPNLSGALWLPIIYHLMGSCGARVRLNIFITKYIIKIPRVLVRTIIRRFVTAILSGLRLLILIFDLNQMFLRN
ncbi:hypothetical protein THICB2_240005 [Thiomonas sp. CB2]|nr:hypothetical protein THICB2_240005 [Thiomonas sp. CB2]